MRGNQYNTRIVRNNNQQSRKLARCQFKRLGEDVRIIRPTQRQILRGADPNSTTVRRTGRISSHALPYFNEEDIW